MPRTGSHRWQLSVALVVTVWSAGTIGAAHANTARALLAQGNKLFASGDYAGALVAFEKGQRSFPSPTFLSSIAFCQVKLHRHEDALKNLRAYLARYPKAKDRDKIAEQIANLEVIAATRISVDSDPPGALVFVDTESSGSLGLTPLRATVAPGVHTLILRKKGYRLTTRSVTIAPRQTASLGKVPLEVALRVTSTPSGAAVFLDRSSRAMGNTPLEMGVVPGRRYDLSVRHKGYRSFSRSLVIDRRGASIAALLSLGLRVTSQPKGAAIEIDGNKTGLRTPAEVETNAGVHRLTLRLVGYRDHTAVVDVRPGRDTDVAATLRGGLLRLRSSVGALVSIDGRALGQSPLSTTSVPLGQHTLRVDHPDRRPWHKALDFSDDAIVDTEVALGRRSWPFWTAFGVTLTSILAGTVTGTLAVFRARDLNAEPVYKQGSTAPIAIGRCLAAGVRNTGNQPSSTPTYRDADAKTPNRESDCNMTLHHVATTAVVTAGVAAVFGLVYYLVAVRPKETIRRLPAASSRTAWR